MHHFRQILILCAVLALAHGKSGDPRLEYSATEAQRRIIAGQFSVQDYVEQLISQNVRNYDLDAFIGFNPYQAMERANEADTRFAASGNPGLLNGMPFVVKDNIHTNDYVCTAGTPGFLNNKPDFIGPVMENLLDAGAVLTGTTNMHELAFGITSENYYFGAVRNPYDKTMFAGGSSGGSAAAVAARIAPVALGTDTGGSIRIPASLNGVYGFRPTQYRYSASGTVPISSYRDTIGIIARYVDDIQIFDEAITGDSQEPSIALSSVRLAIDRDEFFTGLDEEIVPVINNALRALERAGVELVNVDASAVFDNYLNCANQIVFYEFNLNMTTYLDNTPNEYSSDYLVNNIASPGVAGVVGGLFSGAIPRPTETEYLEILATGCADFQAYYQNLMNNVDGLILPTTILAARPIDLNSGGLVDLNGEEVDAFSTYIKHTEYAAVAQSPGISIPAGVTADGLPIGIEIDAKQGDDRRLLAIAERVGKVLANTPRPPITYAAGQTLLAALPMVVLAALAAIF